MTEAIWPDFSSSEAKLKNRNAERMQSHSLAFGICEASVACVHKLAKGLGFLKGPDKIFCHVRKLPPNKFKMRLFG